MATLAVGANAVLGMTPGQTIVITSNFGTNFRYTFAPTNPERAALQNSSRSYGPAAQNVTIGPFDVFGLFTIYNEAGASLTYSVGNSAYEMAGLFVYGAASISPGNANVTISPTGTGTVTINPAANGTMDNVIIGNTGRRTAAFSGLALTSGDSSGTPGNVTNNNPKGRVAIAAGANSVTVTTNLGITAAGTVFAIINQATADATLTQIVRVVPAAGSFTIYGNANATANTVVDFVVILA